MLIIGREEEREIEDGSLKTAYLLNDGTPKLKWDIGVKAELINTVPWEVIRRNAAA